MNSDINSCTGDLVGMNSGDTVTNSYAANTFNYTTPPSFYNGMVVFNSSGTLQNLYWNTQISSMAGIGYVSDNNTIVGLTTAQMKNSANQSGLDSSIWTPATVVCLTQPIRFLRRSGRCTEGSLLRDTDQTYYYAIMVPAFWNAVSGILTHCLRLTDRVRSYALSTDGISANNAAGQAINIIKLGAKVTPAVLDITMGNTSKIYLRPLDIQHVWISFN